MSVGLSVDIHLNVQGGQSSNGKQLSFQSFFMFWVRGHQCLLLSSSFVHCTIFYVHCMIAVEYKNFLISFEISKARETDVNVPPLLSKSAQNYVRIVCITLCSYAEEIEGERN